MHHIMRFLLPIFFIIVLLPGCNQNGATMDHGPFKTYEDQTQHFRIDYPSNWTIDTSSKEVSVGFESQEENVFDRYREVLSVTAYPLPATAESLIDNYQKGMIEGLKKRSPELELVKTSTLKIDNVPAFQLVYKGERNKISLTTIITVVLKNKRGYQIAFACQGENYEKYMPIIEKAISSFKITE